MLLGVVPSPPNNFVLAALDVLVTSASLAPLVTVAFFLGSFMIIWGDSIRKIARYLKQFRAKNFACDKYMGFQPFSQASVRLTFAFELISLAMGASILFILVLTGQHLSDNLIRFVPIAEFALGGIFVLFLQIFQIHRALLRHREIALKSVNERYALLLEPVLQEVSAPIDNPDEILAVHRIRDDVEKIPKWPLNTALMLRIVGVVATGVLTVLFQLGWTTTLLHILFGI